MTAPTLAIMFLFAAGGLAGLRLVLWVVQRWEALDA